MVHVANPEDSWTPVAAQRGSDRQELEETSGALGVITRPKVVDFSARLKERRKANTRMIVMRVAAFVGAVAAIVALVWLLFFSSVFRLESSGISVLAPTNG